MYGYPTYKDPIFCSWIYIPYVNTVKRHRSGHLIRSTVVIFISLKLYLNCYEFFENILPWVTKLRLWTKFKRYCWYCTTLNRWTIMCSEVNDWKTSRKSNHFTWNLQYSNHTSDQKRMSFFELFQFYEKSLNVGKLIRPDVPTLSGRPTRIRAQRLAKFQRRKCAFSITFNIREIWYNHRTQRVIR